KGFLSLKSNRISGQIEGSADSLQVFQPDLTGGLVAKATVSGPISNLEVNGVAEAVGLGYKGEKTSFASGNFRVDKKSAKVSDLNAMLGASAIRGE
ncbi:hypothetical protein, partial [Salmonella enterica]|uniref:hypothetical protein n=1 Tax=Salmonella enterica TaxID=28901 RepID=UPI0020C4C228